MFALAQLGVSGVKNKLESGLDYIVFIIFVSLLSSGIVYLVSFIPFLGPIPNYSYLFWLSFLSRIIGENTPTSISG